MKREKMETILISIGLSFLLGFASLGCLISAFQMSVSLALVGIWCLLAAIIGSICFATRLHLVPVGILAVVLGFMWQKGILLQSIESLVYEVSVVYHKAYDWKILRWSYRTVDELTQTLAPILCLLGVGISLLSAGSICARRSSALSLIAALVPVAACMVVNDKVPNTVYVGLLLFAITLRLLMSLTWQRSLSQGKRLVLWSGLPVALAVSLLLTAVPQISYTGYIKAQQIQDEILSNRTVREIYAAITGKELPQVFTLDGGSVDLTQLGSRSTGDGEIMKIYCQYTGTVYLRSRTLDTYDGLTWTDSGEDTSLFWPSFRKLESAGELEITTRFAHAMLYLPYYTTSLDPGDRGVENSQKLTQYSVAWSQPVTEEYLLSQNPDPKVNRHSTDEITMRQCTDLPAKTQKWAQQILYEILGDTENYYHIAKTVAQYVSQQASYDLNVRKMPANREDFSKWFLEEADKGYCVHYATAAAVLLRAAGIPARYVTGYMVETQYGRLTTVQEADAHAWVEYWLPGFGWTVLEATPAKNSSQTETQPESAQQTPQSQETTSQEQPASTETSQGGWIWISVIGVSVIVLAFFQWQVRRWWLCHWLDRGNRNQRILNRWRLLAHLCRYTRQPPDRELFETAQRAKFGPDILPLEALEPFDRAIQTSRSILCSRNLFAQVYYTLILCLY